MLVAASLAVGVAAVALLADADRLSTFATKDLVTAFGIGSTL